jgi:transcriptional antiterminator NusG
MRDDPVPPLSIPLGPRWYLVRTLRHDECNAQKAIVGLGVETYLPMESHWAKHGRKIKRVTLPLFRQYLFTRFDLERDDWGQIRRAHFVDRIISVDEIPVRVPDQQLEIIRLAEAAGAYDRTIRRPEPPDGFDVGTKVRIRAGPFAGLIAEIRRASPGRRVEILFAILGRETRIRLDKMNLVF